MAEFIELSEISKTYKLGDIAVEALRGIDLSVEQGEFLAIMGASGSGKSTLMNILGCLDVPTSGVYRLNGENVERLSPDELAKIRNRQIGFVFQGFNLLHRMTAVENVEIPMLYSGVPVETRHQRAKKYLQLVGLAGREHHQPHQLSGGQQQRVALARALVNGAPLILADEPTGNLDSKTSVEIMDLIANMNKKSGVTVVLVTHEPEIAGYARRIITVKDGLILSDERNTRRREQRA
ncbi:MAG TPA: macrolide ABC transporter ATP-binding protein [Synergistaceae bacterium]|jgi:putative ABC transport system ATP-binding protein|nr:MAG: ABC transporter related protein [Synergistales bacterium 53_16]KUL02493.1 MAG: ABC transporter related protein [Synergistales bacterium 54_9]MDK2846169.1 putative transport system ATP-binding protein [Synergistales bacterium]MDN5335123.1 putative transport system ATP-binding protein [Synergistales bacterium]HAA47095.1 macrolide ABC transporter ATP-binding protein [Synergistaceae bacterium]